QRATRGLWRYPYLVTERRQGQVEDADHVRRRTSDQIERDDLGVTTRLPDGSSSGAGPELRSDLRVPAHRGSQRFQACSCTRSLSSSTIFLSSGSTAV